MKKTGALGRPKTHNTPEKKAESQNKQKREWDTNHRANLTEEEKKAEYEKSRERLNADPKKKAKVNAQKKASRERINAERTPEEEEAQREYNRIAKQKERERKKNPSKVNIIPSEKDFVSQFKENQMKAACEIAQEL